MDSAEIQKRVKEVKSIKVPNTAGPAWITITNLDPGSTWIVLPQSGVLWIFYEYSNAPAESIQVWHQGGATTPINLGANEIQVGDGDAIVYTLANPAQDMIKLVYQYLD